MSDNPFGRGRIVTATFSRCEDTRTNNCITNECGCECHDDPPLPAGTYITVRLDDPGAAVIGGYVHVQPETTRGAPPPATDLPEERGAVIRVTEFNGVPLPWVVYASRNGRRRWVTLDGTEWPGIGQEAADAEITGWHPITLTPAGDTP